MPRQTWTFGKAIIPLFTDPVTNILNKNDPVQAIQLDIYPLLCTFAEHNKL